jgi:hypothetical protein
MLILLNKLKVFVTLIRRIYPPSINKKIVENFVGGYLLPQKNKCFHYLVGGFLLLTVSPTQGFLLFKTL